MSRRKLARVLDLEKGITRLSAVRSIDASLDLGNGITVPNYETELNAMSSKLSAYNTALSTIDNLYNNCIAQIAVLKDWNERILTGVATKFGKNSSEYEMAGGKRKSERRKPTSKK
ncbi:MAG: hypothetical protein CMP76_13105 [Flavobacterium sp.]|uniref:hypothetical protein n=1 Tax=Flavobacterium sp. TaxID=239 RepID=UPI000C410321|nr:hypothetical protein [Flavobacterium sp.]MBF04224.1 hypothetical protein [Flavobacterium sp.]|tara:strand:+ start:412 stop:759 length:348 start_codon:yes stop_codon:yes gene_type:complete